MFRLKNSDLDLLKLIAEHRLISIDQLVMAHGGGPDVLGKRVKMFEKESFVSAVPGGLGRHRGRPEKFWSITIKGIHVLRDHQAVPSDTKDSSMIVDDTSAAPHLILLNWVLVQLLYLKRSAPFMASSHFSSESPFIYRDAQGKSLLWDQVRIPGAKGPVGFEPDAVFHFQNKEGSKSLLFFVEVDMGTEDYANPDRSPGDIRHKIERYQSYFQNGGYKRFEQLCQTAFNGFRLLFVTHSQKRLFRMCHLTCEMPPSDFIWLTDGQALLAKGIYETIWVRGGHTQRPLQSIIGNQLPAVRAVLAEGPAHSVSI